ncbi:MAG: phosphatase PAP2 family protein [Pyrinomonadaceae bacterium]
MSPRFIPRLSILGERYPRQIAFLKARLSPEGYLGLHLTIGALILIGATWLFAAIAEDVVTKDHIIVVDANFSAWLYAHWHPWTTRTLLIVTHLHGTIGITIITTLVFLYLMRHKYRSQALALVLSVAGGGLLNVILKNVFLRSRPSLENPILTLTSHSFPSGHTMAATCFYGALCVFAVWSLKAWSGRLLAIVTAAFMIMLVGFSRIYLGAHYLSDVLGAIAEGLAWVAICLTAVEVIRRRPGRNGGVELGEPNTSHR